MARNDASTRPIRNRRKYQQREEEFLGINIQERIVSVSALSKLLHKIEDFCRKERFSAQLQVSFADGSECVAVNVDEIDSFLHKEAQNVIALRLYYEKIGNAGRYVVKNTTVAALKCEVTKDKFVVSAQSKDREKIDFTDLLEELKSTIDHLPKKYDKLMRDRYKSVLKIGFGFGLLAALLVMSLPMLDARGREFYAANAFLYILITLVLAAVIGFVFVTVFVIPLYVELLSTNDDNGICDVAIAEKVYFAKHRKTLSWLDKISGYAVIAGVVLLLLMPIVMIWLF